MFAKFYYDYDFSLINQLPVLYLFFIYDFNSYSTVWANFNTNRKTIQSNNTL